MTCKLLGFGGGGAKAKKAAHTIHLSASVMTNK